MDWDWNRIRKIGLVIFAVSMIIFMGFVVLENQKQNMYDICQKCGAQNFSGYIENGITKIACDEVPVVLKCP